MWDPVHESFFWTTSTCSLFKEELKQGRAVSLAPNLPSIHTLSNALGQHWCLTTLSPAMRSIMPHLHPAKCMISYDDKWGDLRRKPIWAMVTSPESSFILKPIGYGRDSPLGLYHSSPLKIPKWDSSFMWYPNKASIWKLVGYSSSLEFIVVPFGSRVVG